MKIWFDLTNSPHIHFFRGLIEELKKDGHEVLITTRDQANTIDLLKLYNIEYHIVGRSYGKSLWNKIFGNFHRVWSLIKYIKSQRVDVGISQSSFTSPIAGFFVGVPTIYTNDNEHAMGNKIAFLFANKIFIPEFIPISNVSGLFVNKRKVSQYPGVKEGIYLWRRLEKPQHIAEVRNKVYYRPEPYSAQYYKGKANPFDDVLISLKDECEIVILPRDKNQVAHFEQEQFQGIMVCRHPKTFDEIASDCRLFIGAGGTMTREMAVLGIPTISVYQDKLLDVDHYLIDNGLMTYCPNLTNDDVRKALMSSGDFEPNLTLLHKGKRAYNMIKTQLFNL